MKKTDVKKALTTVTLNNCNMTGYSGYLKGQSHDIFVLGFFPQTTPPGPIRDVLGLF